MIPILYDPSETAFASNGLGRLRDMISAVVFEERNGAYELDFQYPIDGEKYSEIQIGSIIGVTHDDTGDIQPFDVVSFTRPIDGVVTFHCTHISYRQSYLITYPALWFFDVLSDKINSLADAFKALSKAVPTNPFTYTTDKDSTGYAIAFEGTPKSVRSLLGGVEGSILDAYGGEYEWDKFEVILHSSRGTARDFSIRYGVNMLDYNEELDSSGTYMSCVPYWTDGTSVIIGDRQVGSGATLTNRGECLPLDVSDKFETPPTTKAEVEAMGLQVLNALNPAIPAQTIHVEFVRLQDMGYEGLENLLECQLCDTVNVVFPYYNTVGKFKIVKTVWDVLADRYESMELGDLSVTLAEALGIKSGSGTLSDSVTDVRVDGVSVVSSGVANIPSLVVDTATASDISVSANSTKAFQVDVTKTGYTPLGVVGYNWSGTGRSHFIIYNMSLSGNTVSMAFGNENGNARSGMGITLYVLYKSN